MLRTVLISALAWFGACASPLLAQGWEWQNPLPRGYAINDVLMADASWAYAPCADGWFMRSGDGGRNWEIRRAATRSLQKVVSPSLGVVVVVCDDGTILRSTDYGVTWTQRYRSSSGGSGAFDLKRSPAAGMLALFGGNVFVHSTDDGLTWSSVGLKVGGSESLRSIAIQSGTTWYCISNRSVYKTTDRGANWDSDPSLSPTGLIALSFIDSLYGYQLRSGQLLQTHDGGDTWAEMNIFGFDNNLAVAAGPALGGAIYCLSTGNYLVNKSTDDGATWNVSLTSTVFSDGYPAAISFLDADHGLIVGEGGRIVRTDNGGVSWSIIHGLGYVGPMADMVFMSPRNGIALSFEPTILLTTNGGTRWEETVPHPDYAPRRISMYTPTAGYVVAFDVQSNSHVLSTTNSGRAWTYRGPLPIPRSNITYIQPQGILAVSADTVFIGVSDGLLYRTVDGGAHWDSLFTCSMFLNDWESGGTMYWFPPRTLIYTGSQGVSRSTDAGDTWLCFSMNGLSNVQFFHADTGIATAQGRIATTFSGGEDWSWVSNRGDTYSHFFNLREGVGLSNQSSNGVNSGVLQWTSDGGATWTRSNLHESIDEWYGWRWTSKDEAWSYGSGGMIRHTRNGGLTWAGDVPASPTSRVLGPLYPNPFSIGRHRAISINMQQHDLAARHATLELYSVLGRRVVTLFDGALAGGQVVTFDSRTVSGGLKPGAYILRLTAGAIVEHASLLVTD
jgi:photosystem II stability/assembly factor-like uncharacterized protein